MTRRPTIAILPTGTAAPAGCSGAEPYALMVLGDSMSPEFVEGDVIVVEPGGLACDGSFVVAEVDGTVALRQLVSDGQSWRLLALSSTCRSVALASLASVRGVVIQRSRPGRPRSRKRYVD